MIEAYSARLDTFDTATELMLAELMAAHQRLLEAMAELGRLTSGPLPTKELIIDTRWEISRASLARRSLWNRIYDHLSHRTSKLDSDDIGRLNENDKALLRASSEHVTKWNISAVLEDWPGYCAASRSIRWKMRAGIGAEQRILYPLMRATGLRRR